MTRAIYRGFSTFDWKTRRTFELNNIELVKRDILTHIFTEKGERVMMPNFGTRIPTLAFEPNDEHSRAIVEQDLREVFEYDPRVELINLSVVTIPDNNAMVALADLLYIEFNVRDVLRIDVPTQ
jgi:phage baseplate assembly protein W